MIEVWFDEKYKEFFYTREPMARFLDMGNITQQLEMKKRLNCKSFAWFMEEVAYDVLDKYPELPPNLHWGEVNDAYLFQLLSTTARWRWAHISAQFETKKKSIPQLSHRPVYRLLNYLSMLLLLSFNFIQLRNVAARQCLDTMGHGPPSLMGISHCHGFGNNQVCNRLA